MKKKANRSPALHIPVEHQSAPKKHWADVECEKAAEEIRSGQFVPDMTDYDDPLCVGLQRGQLPKRPSDIDINQTAETLILAQHPRVKEALARLELEKRESKNPQEVLEKTAMLHELNERVSSVNQWDDQGRWIGKENEDMRIGLILGPFEFMRRLERVIGEGRIFLNGYAVLKRVALLAKDPTESLIYLPGQPKRADGLVQVATLQYPCSSEWMVMRFDSYGVPIEPKYLGWRTALLQLIQFDLITEKEAHKAFPLGSPNKASQWYREQLYIMRSRKGTVQ